jgi:hypothetical protein
MAAPPSHCIEFVRLELGCQRHQAEVFLVGERRRVDNQMARSRTGTRYGEDIVSLSDTVDHIMRPKIFGTAPWTSMPGLKLCLDSTDSEQERGERSREE